MTQDEIRAIAQQLHIKLPMATQEDAENFLIAALAAINEKAEPDLWLCKGSPNYTGEQCDRCVPYFLHPAPEPKSEPVGAAPLPDDNRLLMQAFREVKAINSGAAPLPDAQLCRFYDVDNFPDLVAAMEHHIEKLQAKLPPTPSLAPTRVREG